MLYGLVLVIHLLACLVLIAVILLQAGRGGGLSDAFGGGAQSIFGTRGTVYLTRATTAFAAIFMVTSFTLAVISVHRGRSLLEKAPTVQKADLPAPQQAQPVQRPALEETPPRAPAQPAEEKSD